MKKIIIAAAFASVAAFGLSGVASAEYDVSAECMAAQTAESGIDDATWAAACACLVDSVGGDAAITGSFEASGGDQTKWSPEAAAAVAACFPAAPAAE
jgi:hypothetical protein